ncbi:RecX family transcriptional regulator [Novosphingobium sp. FKTRR1]|uniref:RecX family transcriptional regulator n=1 Tax=Novosphingobium sp. FKTRR1 TaxID=2879118 RepID=UPI001CEFF3E1|nr:RecX family transcriptional regulator [Novosphingobium sp. FKTRR1]
MHDEQNRPRRARPIPPQLDDAQLEELALGYVARFATSTGKLADYLKRKLRERGWDEDTPAPDIPALLARFAERGFIDDAGYAQARSETLRRRGLGDRRIDQTLNQAGIGADLRAANRSSERAAREAALAFARKRRLGPFAGRGDPGAAPSDPKTREKHIAALLRGGHALGNARFIVNAVDVAEIEEWVLEGIDDDEPAQDHG